MVLWPVEVIAYGLGILQRIVTVIVFGPNIGASVQQQTEAVDALRRANRHPTLSLDQNQKELPDGEVRSLVELIESRGPGPLDLAEGEERRKRVRASVDGLPEFLRQVVILAYYQGLKYREIADILDIPVGTVKSRLHAALVKLQEIWSQSPSLREV